MTPQQEATGWCEACGRQVLIRRKGINHLLHLLLTILTAGVWVVVWFLVLFVTRPWRCTICGMGASRSKGL